MWHVLIFAPQAAFEGRKQLPNCYVELVTSDPPTQVSFYSFLSEAPSQNTLQNVIWRNEALYYGTFRTGGGHGLLAPKVGS